MATIAERMDHPIANIPFPKIFRAPFGDKERVCSLLLKVAKGVIF